MIPQPSSAPITPQHPTRNKGKQKAFTCQSDSEDEAEDSQSKQEEGDDVPGEDEVTREGVNVPHAQPYQCGPISKAVLTQAVDPYNTYLEGMTQLAAKYNHNPATLFQACGDKVQLSRQVTMWNAFQAFDIANGPLKASGSKFGPYLINFCGPNQICLVSDQDFVADRVARYHARFPPGLTDHDARQAIMAPEIKWYIESLAAHMEDIKYDASKIEA